MTTERVIFGARERIKFAAEIDRGTPALGIRIAQGLVAVTAATLFPGLRGRDTQSFATTRARKLWILRLAGRPHKVVAHCRLLVPTAEKTG
jgi:hypothetical protein